MFGYLAAALLGAAALAAALIIWARHALEGTKIGSDHP